MSKITINRYEFDATATVYRGAHYCGVVFCPIEGGRSDYLASPWTDAMAQIAFATEVEAIDYLVREG